MKDLTNQLWAIVSQSNIFYKNILCANEIVQKLFVYKNQKAFPDGENIA